MPPSPFRCSRSAAVAVLRRGLKFRSELEEDGSDGARCAAAIFRLSGSPLPSTKLSPSSPSEEPLISLAVSSSRGRRERGEQDLLVLPGSDAGFSGSVTFSGARLRRRRRFLADDESETLEGAQDWASPGVLRSRFAPGEGFPRDDAAVGPDLRARSSASPLKS